MRAKFLLVLLVAMVYLAGCGGTSLLGNFTGSYIGIWTQSSPADSGNIAFVVLPAGSLSGTFHENVGNIDYTLSGTIADTGAFNGTLTPSSGPTLTLSGTLSVNGQNHLVGNLNSTGGTLTTIAVDLTPQ